MNKSDHDRAKSALNLQKLYSSQVIENYGLQRQKSDLDHEKIKKLRELNNNEHLFLRKYKKYAVPGRRGRRGSIDAELVRAIDERGAKSRSKRQSAGKSFISNDCAYSFETWNRFLDIEKSVLDENKREILFSDDDQANQNNDSLDEDTEMILDEMARTNISLLEQGKLLRKRQTLKPLETTKANFDDEAIDEEILEIQFKNKKRGRRHSVALGALHSGQLGKDPVLRLPSINESFGSITHKSTSSLDLNAQKFHSSDENISGLKLTKNRRKLSLSDNEINLSMPSPVQETYTNNDSKFKETEKASRGKERLPSLDNAADSNNSVSPEVKISTDNGAKDVNTENKSFKQKNNQRPVPNATIFVRGETSDKQNSIFDCENNPDKMRSKNCDDGENSSILPRIDIANLHDVANDTKKEKHISFEDENQTSVRCDSRSSKLTHDTDNKPVMKSGGRRGSLATASLKLLVDSHHGAAKLRYIAKLAHEMEKEEIAKFPPEPEPDIYKELNSCRYLRVPRKNSSESQQSEVN